MKISYAVILFLSTLTVGYGTAVAQEKPPSGDCMTQLGALFSTAGERTAAPQETPPGHGCATQLGALWTSSGVVGSDLTKLTDERCLDILVSSVILFCLSL